MSLSHILSPPSLITSTPLSLVLSPARSLVASERLSNSLPLTSSLSQHVVSLTHDVSHLCLTPTISLSHRFLLSLTPFSGLSLTPSLLSHSRCLSLTHVLVGSLTLVVFLTHCLSLCPCSHARWLSLFLLLPLTHCLSDSHSLICLSLSLTVSHCLTLSDSHSLTCLSHSVCSLSHVVSLTCSLSHSLCLVHLLCLLSL